MNSETFDKTLFIPQEEISLQEDASTGQRVANYLIDFIVFAVAYYGLAILFGVFIAVSGNTYNVSDDTVSGNVIIDYAITYLLYIVYYTFCEGASGGRTIGKLVTRTKAVKEDNTSITWGDALKRTLCRIVPFETISGLGGYPWHDKWTNTKVIKNNKV